MGKRRISIAPIKTERNKNITFNKRRAGLLKKAYELSVLCKAEIGIVMFDSHGKAYTFGSFSVKHALDRFAASRKRKVEQEEKKTNYHYRKTFGHTWKDFCKEHLMEGESPDVCFPVRREFEAEAEPMPQMSPPLPAQLFDESLKPRDLPAARDADSFGAGGVALPAPARIPDPPASAEFLPVVGAGAKARDAAPPDDADADSRLFVQLIPGLPDAIAPDTGKV
eukprot:gnl/Chilomastix_cuspidata/1807.p1 GENE.gnl/Chilomastix_cuspidata/1807~~gnl/Chilomastix_cuspidata/1807.p1  ORF type:complete len:250 (+),score=77.45 gnl/Chilomastix_cuspidata/1807:81-752(+)